MGDGPIAATNGHDFIGQPDVTQISCGRKYKKYDVKHGLNVHRILYNYSEFICIMNAGNRLAMNMY
jgi:hypothetical protein